MGMGTGSCSGAVDIILAGGQALYIKLVMINSVSLSEIVRRSC